MPGWRLFHRCVWRSRCPLCGEGALFDGFIHMRGTCAICGLDYDQWVGEWITPTYLASTAGMLVAIALAVAMLATGVGLDGPLSPELAVAIPAGGVALLSLRPSKAFWLAFLYGIGGIEVSAETRARLRWTDPEAESTREAERRARRVRPRHAAPVLATVRRFPSLRELLFPRVRATPTPESRASHGAESGRERR